MRSKRILIALATALALTLGLSAVEADTNCEGTYPNQTPAPGDVGASGWLTVGKPRIHKDGSGTQIVEIKICHYDPPGHD